MQENWLLLMKGLIPELSELETDGYTIDGVVRGTLTFDINATHETKNPVNFAGYYQTNGGVTRVKFERFVKDVKTGEDVSETADFTITKLTRDFNLFEEVWRDIDDELIRAKASIVTGYRASIQMPLIGEPVKDIKNTMAYKRYLKDKNKDGLRRLVLSIIEETSGN